METSEILNLLKEIKAKINQIEKGVPEMTQPQYTPDEVDETGVLWKNRAMEYKRKLDACLENIGINK